MHLVGLAMLGFGLGLPGVRADPIDTGRAPIRGYTTGPGRKPKCLREANVYEPCAHYVPR
jgi:hypothetical protein